MKYLEASEATHRDYRITSRHLIRWIRNGLVLPGLSAVPGRAMLIGVEDLISMRVIAALRTAGVSFRRIYQAEAWLRENVGYPRPFAVESVWSDRTEVFVEFKHQLITASRAGQMTFDLFREYIIPIHGISFEEEVAASWEPRDRILLDPELQFGAPCIRLGSTFCW